MHKRIERNEMNVLYFYILIIFNQKSKSKSGSGGLAKRELIAYWALAATLALT